MARMLPDTFSKGSTPLTKANKEQLRVAYGKHKDCAAQCARDGVAVEVGLPNATQVAAETLRRCGVVHLVGAYDLALLDKVERAIDKLRASEKSFSALLDTIQLHDSRYQVYLPFTAPFNSREALGVGDS